MKRGPQIPPLVKVQKWRDVAQPRHQIGPDPWIPGPASKPGKSMHFEASAILDRKPLCFTYKNEWNFEKIQKSCSETLVIHSVFALEFSVVILLSKPIENLLFWRGQMCGRWWQSLSTWELKGWGGAWMREKSEINILKRSI